MVDYLGGVIMKCYRILMVLLLLGFSTATVSMASPLTLDYSVNNVGPGLYHYSFDLIMDNHDSSWAPGQGWSWITFGDALSASSPLTGFTLDNNILPVGPFARLDFSSGGHNGPTWLLDISNQLTYWTPASIGETLNWSGTSTANLLQGDLLFSTLLNNNGANQANFEIANRIDNPNVVPEPSTLWIVGNIYTCQFIPRISVSA
jgi:hypothetical protein